MQLSVFIAKTVCLTVCLGVLLYLFYPRYERVENNKRFDTVTGSTERYVETHGFWTKCYG